MNLISPRRRASALIAILSMVVGLLGGCSTPRITVQQTWDPSLSPRQQLLIDSVLQRGLDHEALYTLLGRIKPMSSLCTFTFPIANADSTKKSESAILDLATHGDYLKRLAFVQEAINKIDLPDLKFLMIPYRSSYHASRTVQLSVVRVSLLDSLLEAKAAFFGQFGLVPGSAPEVVVSTIEYNDPFERWRGYGYLFGYPDYAVDFFIQADVDQQRTGVFVERKAFRIPTYAKPEGGNFVYTHPLDYRPTADVDSVLYDRAEVVLQRYQAIRPTYMKADSTIAAYRLLHDFYHHSAKECEQESTRLVSPTDEVGDEPNMLSPDQARIIERLMYHLCNALF